MGQYHQIFNLDKREFINPHVLGCGLKLREQANTAPGTLQALFAALVCSNNRGGGDFGKHEWVGRWVGDRVVVVGDYTEPDDIPGYPDAKTLGGGGSVFADVSALAASWIEQEYEGQFKGGGWRDFVSGGEAAARRG